MTNAWRLLTSAILRLAAAKRCSSASAISGWKMSLRSERLRATASRVTSSSVGPRPPERITISDAARRPGEWRRQAAPGRRR